MSSAPIFELDINTFWKNPYPILREMRKNNPICYVPQLKSTLFTKRNSIADNEKRIDVFSSNQPGGLMTTLMGKNMMRKDGDMHIKERKSIRPTISPKTVKNVWKDEFIKNTELILKKMKDKNHGDIVKDFAMPVSAEALKTVTGLSNMDFREMDRVSQGMIDGIANIQGDKNIEANCNDCTKSIDQHISEIFPRLKRDPNKSLISVQYEAGLSETQNRANVKLAISGGQNEPRDAIAGTVWALLTHQDQLDLILSNKYSWLNAFEEYSRWMSPIGMSPRRITKDIIIENIQFEKDERIFFMFGSGNRDEEIFDDPFEFKVDRSPNRHLAFGHGAHLCLGKYLAKIEMEIFYEELFKKIDNIQLNGEPEWVKASFVSGLKSLPIKYTLQ